MHTIKKLIPQSLKNLYHLAQAVAANVWYGGPARRSYASGIAGGPSRKIKVIGITGTNGKTTTTQMVTRILEEAGKKVAMASTINFKLGEKEWTNATKFTTVSAFAVQKFIKEAVAANCEYLVLETSSHALDQARVWGIEYDTVAITNVTREHLDYHKTMEEYRKAKALLFQKNPKVAVVNLDMENPEEFMAFNAEKKYGYTVKNSNFQSPISKFQIIKAENIELGINFSKFKIQNLEFTLNLPGMFNVENALAATCVALGEGIELEVVKDALLKIKGVAGRLEAVENKIGATILIDYAVTPDSLEKLYSFVFGLKKAQSKVIAVFGSCGERDRGKRPIMGKIVSKYADFVIVTNEDPYHEDPIQIIEEVSGGVEGKKEGVDFWKIMDRREAIGKALSLAKSDDIVVITGKGAEETMALGDKRIPWNEKKVIQEELNKL